MPPLLSVSGLTVASQVEETRRELVRQVDFDIQKGDLVGLVGESGSGKTMTALALMGLLPSGCRVRSGRIDLAGENLLDLPELQMRGRRGCRVAMIFQEPMTALNPVLTVGYQVAEAVRAHRGGDRRSCRQEAERLLERVSIGAASARLHDYPHQLSGGQRQRVMMAMALAGEPDLLIADEPTSALDVTIQLQILELLKSLQSETGLTILLITHDLGVVAETCDRVMVMYAGELVEQAAARQFFDTPGHPYSRALLAMVRAGAEKSEGPPWPTLGGSPPRFDALPMGCSFHTRCGEALPVCREDSPPETQLPEGRRVRCWLHETELGDEVIGK